MKRLLIVILAAALLWCGYWFVGAQGARTAFAGWFDARRADGWQAEYSDLSVRGFPNRFDTTFTDLALADPDTGWMWEAPFFQLLALSYKPTSVIAVFPPESQLATPQGTLALATPDLRASLSLSPAPRLPLDRARLVGTDLRVAGAGETLDLTTLRLAAERLPAAEAGYHLGALVEGMDLPDALLARLGQRVALPEAMDSLRIDADVTFDRPWDLDAIERARPQPRRIALRLAEAAWGPLGLAATGELTVDPQGVPTGTLSLKAENWRDMLRLAVAAGALGEGMAATAERGLGLIANLSGRPDTLNVSLEFRDGGTFLGPVPLGPAPRLILR